MPRIAYTLQPAELEFSAMRAQGAGGQNVNKVSSAVMLRLNIPASSLPTRLKERVLAMNDKRITEDGVLIIKAQEHRSQPMNRAAALARVMDVLEAAAHIPVTRVATKPTRASKTRRLDGKVQRGQVKQLRQRRVTDE